MSNPLRLAQDLGQSIWIDYIRRGVITSGELARLIEDDGVSGLTSNPAIFEKAIAGSRDYDPALRALIRRGVGSAEEIYEHLALEDIAWAADLLYPVYERTDGRDGYASFEVSPHLAHDTQGSIREARRLFALLGRDNVFIKIPGTPAGVPAVRQLIADGINVNVTLLFAVDAYEAVAEAYFSGLEERAARGEDLRRVASVASFFVSRIDTLVDSKLDALAEATADAARREKLEGLRGRVAVANARLAYARWRELYGNPRWQALAAKGARPQRLLWASTSTKNPAYSKTLYVDELLGPDTVNTMPPETLEAFRAEARPPRARLVEDWPRNLQQARATLAALDEAGVSLREATDTLLVEAVKKFADPFDGLLSAVEKKREVLHNKG